ncbi:putative methylase [Testicularia cyperi]|uniref:Putative methylase n=1 Tax=Testicularia cyperi TaxID=1882483 RepID=A0A317XJS9_9BASI|nr:putative methylase [Testicularia cyperi]
MIPTPSLTHLTKDDYRKVYEPAEDSFILLDALEEDAHALSQRQGNDHQGGRLCVEIGTGSGVVTAFLAKIIGSTEAAYIGIDLNPDANRCTLATGLANDVRVEAVRTSLFSSLRPRLDGKVDVLVFNPPYVPTEEEEEMMAQDQHGIEGAWAGGATGTKLVDQLIDSGTIEQILAPGGSFYLVAIRQNDPPMLVARLQARGLLSEIVLARRAGREHLHVIRATKPP